MAREHARDHEQQVRQAVQVLRHFDVDLLVRGQRPHAALGAPHDGARQVAVRGRGAAARQDEVLERGQRVVELVEHLLELRDAVRP